MSCCLACCTFEEAATQDTEADGGTERAGANQDGYCYLKIAQEKCECVLH